ncbi:hypothetical protein PYCCODRAFT_54395 [Trametes coccinea BRFM310]|uniref:Uncharacterized protein n=1 Tax=Trametes coccinea (strain BRFM310) TaxID=1353009 RepID=A0A1Y2J5U3_TRAC3|nr:hypothetical protein PYCCODRAFT_54395 [Trametes coccinea BRFM310]
MSIEVEHANDSYMTDRLSHSPCIHIVHSYYSAFHNLLQYAVPPLWFTLSYQTCIICLVAFVRPGLLINDRGGTGRVSSGAPPRLPAISYICPSDARIHASTSNHPPDYWDERRCYTAFGC